MDFRNRYIEMLLQVALQVREGESLSVNTNPSHMEFSKDLAQQASEITRQPVHVVRIDDGIPGDVLSFTPLMHDQLATPPTRAVLLRLDDTEDRDWQIGVDPKDILADLSLLQRSGNLAPPQLIKPVAPWSVVAVPGPRWAAHVLGARASELDLWKLFSDILNLGAADVHQSWQEHASMIRHRLNVLNGLDCTGFHIQGTDTDLTVGIVDESRWRGGVHTLADGRSFMPYLPAERVSMLASRIESRGTVRATRPFSLLGSLVEGAVFRFFEGAVVEFDATAGKDVLTRALDADEGASRLSELSLVDNHTSLAMRPERFGYVGFDENQVSSIALGMGEAHHIEALQTYEDESELQRETGCNVSIIRFRVPIGSGDLSVGALLSDGSEKPIMQNGVFKI